MIVPFLLMFSGSMKGQYNSSRLNLVPQYLYDDLELYRTWCESKYTKIDNYNASNEIPYMSFSELEVLAAEKEKELLKQYKSYLNENVGSIYNSRLGHVNASNKNLPELGLEFIRHLDDNFGGLNKTNQALKLNMPNWQSLAGAVIQQNFFSKSFTANDSALMTELIEFKQQANQADLFYPSVDGQFRSQMILPFTGTDLEEISKMTGLEIKAIHELHLSHTQGNDWYNKQRSSFIRQFLNPRYIDLKKTATQKINYQDFIKNNFLGDINTAQKVFPHLSSFEEIELITQMPNNSQEAVLYGAYIERSADFDSLLLRGPQRGFQGFLLDEYGDLKSINKALKRDFNSIHEIYIPQSSLDYNYVLENKTKLRWDLASINIRFVFNYLTQQGRAAWVTLVFCLLTIISSLIVNPLAAYALSRYQLPSTYKILMFFMATMAFPVAVTQIPSFLLLKDLGLLNTFWALVLPTMANGYSIFILKGFFDSLPKELYEAASIDGAGEFRMFWQITLNLSKPVLALIALNSFTAAYGNFMYALLICQDESMWTIMVYLFKLQTEASQAVIYASLVVAGIPTLIIFLSCQKVIMKGIVIPSEK
ncbi:carbohydrate ABC transporter permease [Lentisphaera profundi]|uniref:sn-glycerol-3-phosphate transport system permease protein UgpE n=1 Tax=Lentisphaera profundi TaxID=1658616 RepID=A0ABY7W2P4_9BACT|nr:carbohydrate ABC transporter permease [Lentisphaera profundi]WDE99266.1 carbohydrate ABC transporter permease [Lentisphaera profundi]